MHTAMRDCVGRLRPNRAKVRSNLSAFPYSWSLYSLPPLPTLKDSGALRYSGSTPQRFATYQACSLEGTRPCMDCLAPRRRFLRMEPSSNTYRTSVHSAPKVPAIKTYTSSPHAWKARLSISILLTGISETKM